MIEDTKFRLGVIGVFVDENSRILVCERSNRIGSWQFPQGGIDPGENPRAALEREMREELGTGEFVVLKTGEELTAYDFPDDADFALTKKYKGQKHHWFLLKFSKSAQPCLPDSDGEFCAWKWVKIEECLSQVIYWKLDAYRQGLQILGLIENKE